MKLLEWAGWLAWAPAAAAGAYYLVALVAAWVHLRRREPAATELPPVSILKPVNGRDPRFYQAIRSHATQCYREFEILFGVTDPGDPAIEDIERLRREFPAVPIRLLVLPGGAPNGKVGVLAGLAPQARYPLLLVNDSDIDVEPDYLQRVVAPLADPKVGLITCLYRARAETWPARWEALGIATEFAPGVLVAPLAGAGGFALGSTMVFRREQLDRIGGFRALERFLADDYQLGKRIAGLGYRVHLSQVVVETNLGGESWREAWRHQVRWARTIRVSRPAGYCGYLVTQASVWSLLAALTGHGWVAIFAMSARLATGLLVGSRMLRDPDVPRLWPLIPLRDLWGFAVWLAGLAGDSVEWRGQRLRLSRHGEIVKSGATVHGQAA